LTRLTFVVKCLSFCFLYMKTAFNMYRPKCVCYTTLAEHGTPSSCYRW